MNNELYHVLFKLLSFSDESDIRMVVSSLLGYLLGKGKIPLDEIDEYISYIKKRLTVFQPSVSWVYRYATNL